MSSFLYYNAIKVAKQSINDKMNSQADFFVDSIDQQIMNIKNMMYDLFSARKLVFLVNPNSTLTDYERREAILTEQERLNSLKNSSLLVKTATLYLPKANLKISNDVVEALSGEDMSFIEKHYPSVNQIMNVEDNKLFMVSTGTPYDKNLSMTEAFFYVELNRDKIIDTLSTFNTIKNSGSFLFQQNQNILFESNEGGSYGKNMMEYIRSDPNHAEENSLTLNVDKQKFLTVIRKSDYFGLFVQYNPEKEVLRDLQMYKWLVFIYIVVMLFLSVSISAFTERNIHKPLVKLLRAFSRVEHGNFNSELKLAAGKGNEFSYLYDGFNHMTLEIRNLIEEVYIQKNLTQRAELKQLQAQINPHFLYNSFFSLSQKIKRGDNAIAEEFAQHLGVFFRFLTKNNSDDVPLALEVEHARSYTSIQGSRFYDRIHIEFEELPERYNDLLVPRLILQPIIENAFEHGLENKEENGMLQITFAENGPYFEIHVADNGEESSGLYPDQINSGLENREQCEVTGLLNIHKRLKIYYGERSGLEVRRSALGGVEVIIKLIQSKYE
ncbi:hypothetical protein R70331_07600 [Paenibacillus sp. FSL R7-0331]|nr:hypothetical protein R70331_07600 [Paenibacillus sp. FSL R7-0331]